MAFVMSSGYLTLDGTVQRLSALAPNMFTDPVNGNRIRFNTISFWAPKTNTVDIVIGCGPNVNTTTGVDLFGIYSPGQGEQIEAKQGDPFEADDYYVQGVAGQQLLIKGLRV